jgi:tRNA dimethylallyltransferase
MSSIGEQRASLLESARVESAPVAAYGPERAQVVESRVLVASAPPDAHAPVIEFAPTVGAARVRAGMFGGTRIGMILGPTGAGKTAFAIALAERLGAEIVNADSRQLYRGMDLGTAKPDAADRARVAHHLIDVCDAGRPIDVAEFAALARAAIAAIAARGRPALIVGGSGLYVRVLRGGIFAGPPADSQYRAELGAQAAAHGAGYLHERLGADDPEAARRIKVNDLPRIIRALEVFKLSGIPISEHQRRHRSAPGGCENLAVGLTVPRAQLYERIDRRFDSMIAAGLVAEVRDLIAAGAPADHQVWRTIGYREVARYLAGAIDLPAAIAQAKRESRRLAKRQMTWFRRERDVVWLDPERDLEAALGRFREFFHPRFVTRAAPGSGSIGGQCAAVEPGTADTE